jgi:hypothetical protein
MLNLIQKDKILGKHVYFNSIFTQNLEFSYADTSAASADYFMSADKAVSHQQPTIFASPLAETLPDTS